MKRGFFYFLAAGVVMLLLTGMSGCNWLSRSPLPLFQGGTQTPAAVMFVPKQAAVMASLLVNPDRLDSSAAAGRPQERRRLRTELQKLKTSLLAKTGLDYRQDIQPWLGDEITLAVTSPDVDRNGDNGKQTGYFMAIATKDAAKSREFLQLLFSKRAIADSDLVFEQYKGVKLIYHDQRIVSDVSPTTKRSTASPSSLAGAVVGNDFVLLANNPKVLRDAINNVQAPSLSLASSDQYQQALTLLPPKRIGLTFLNLPVLSAWRGLAPANQTHNSQIIALQLQPQGLLAETSLLGTVAKESPTAPTESQPIGALKYIPAATGFALSGSDLSHLNQTDLSQTWNQIATGLLGNNSKLQLFDQPLAPLKTHWGIDLPEDIFSWARGEYALGLLPHADQLAPDWIFVAEKLDDATAAISRLDTIATSQGLSVSSLTLGEQKIAAWTQLTTATTSTSGPDHSLIALKAKVQGVHATVGNYEIFTTSVEAMDEAIKSPKIGALANDANFQAGLNAIPQPNQGYVYLDWTASQEILERQLPILKLLELAVNPFFNNLQSLTLSSYSNNPEVLKSGVFFQFGKPVAPKAVAQTRRHARAT